MSDASKRRAEAHIRRHGREPNRSMSFVPQKHEQVPKVYRIYPGVVRSVKPYGAYIEMEGFTKHGLLHISQLSKFRVESIDEVVKEGDPVFVKVLSVGTPEDIKISLTIKSVNQTNGKDDDPNHVEAEQDKLRSRTVRSDEVKRMELGAVLNTTCKTCGTRGHLAKDCFSQGKTYALLVEEEDTEAPEGHDKKDKKHKHKKSKKHKKEKKHRHDDDRSSRRDNDDRDSRRDNDDRRGDRSSRDARDRESPPRERDRR